LFLLLSLSAGCATVVRLEPGTPIESEPTWASHRYTQRGTEIPKADLWQGLMAFEPAGAEAEEARSLHSAGSLFAGLGTTGLVFGAIDKEAGVPGRLAMIAGGAGLWALAIKCGREADRHLEAAVKAYNAQFLVPAEVSLAPFVAPVAPASGHRSSGGIEAGLVLRF
jgi:hypothetical protein